MRSPRWSSSLLCWSPLCATFFFWFHLWLPSCPSLLRDVLPRKHFSDVFFCWPTFRMSFNEGLNALLYPPQLLTSELLSEPTFLQTDMAQNPFQYINWSLCLQIWMCRLFFFIKWIKGKNLSFILARANTLQPNLPLVLPYRSTRRKLNTSLTNNIWRKHTNCKNEFEKP